MIRVLVLFLCFATALIASISPTPAAPDATASPAPAANSTSGDTEQGPFVSLKGYQILPPSGWVPVSPSGSIDSMFVAPDQTTPPPCISVAVIPIPGGAPVADENQNLRDTIITGEKGLAEFDILQDNKTTLGGAPALESLVTFRSSAKGPVLNVDQFFICHGHMGYIITCTAQKDIFRKSTADFAKAMTTFQFDTGDGRAFISIDGYALVPPRDWAVKTDAETNGAYFVELGDADFATNISVKTQPLPDGVTALDIYHRKDDLISDLTTGMTAPKTIDVEMTSLSGVDGVLTEVSFLPPQVSFRVWRYDIYAVHGGKLIQVTMMSKEEDSARSLGILTPVLASFRWVKLTPAPGPSDGAAPPAGNTAPAPAPTAGGAPAGS